MNPFQFSGDDFSTDSAPARWFPGRWMKWPEDYRSCLDWLFAVSIVTSFVNIARAIFHPRSYTFLQNILAGPAFYSVLAAMCGVTLWAIWKDKAWSRILAVGTSVLYSLQFLRQFVIPGRPAWDHYVASLIGAILGIFALSWRDKRVDAVHSDQTL